MSVVIMKGILLVFSPVFLAISPYNIIGTILDWMYMIIVYG